MSTANNPAFPTMEYYDEKPIGQTWGMTLRDYFAGQAATGAFRGGDTDIDDRVFARRCYELADTLLAERDK